MVVVDELYQDIILGKQWLTEYDVLIDCKRHKLIWPDKRRTYIASHEVEISKDALEPQEPDSEHQADADRRDKNLELQRRIRILPRNSSYKQDEQQALKTMQRQLDTIELPTEPDATLTNRKVVQSKRDLPTADIALVSAVAFKTHLRNKKSEFFLSSLYEIDRILEELQKNEPPSEESELEMLYQTVPKEYHDLIEVFSKAASDQLPPHRKCDHKIELQADVPLGYHPLYQQTAQELEALKAYLQENLEKGFIEVSSAPFASPVLFVKKPNGGLRFCIDYRKLNEMTRKDRYPLPLLDETLARINNAKVFTKLDIRQAFHRIRMDPASEELTTFRTRYGQYKCKVLPFGLTNGPATYQRYMNDVLFEYLDDFCTAYLDDIIIYSKDPKEHASHVRKVLLKLKEAGLQADIKKCEFSVTRTKYLGFIISTEGIEVDPEKISAIKNWRYPKGVKGVQAFLGFCNFYRRFIEGYGKIARPLNLCTRKDRAFDFDERCRQAFDKLKQSLTNTPILAHYHPERETMLETDSSDGTVGGILSQKQSNGLWKPVAYFSKSMIPAEYNYPIHDKELLAIIRAFEEWRAELAGLQNPLKVFSDHKALEYFMTKKNLSARQARWAELLSQYHFKIMYQTAAKNHKADSLTRRENDVREYEVAKKETREQVMLPERNLSDEVQGELANQRVLAPVELDAPPEINVLLIDELLQANRTHQELETLRDQAQIDKEGPYQLMDGLLLFENRLVVPDHNNLRTKLIREAHDQRSTAHPGAKKTTKILKSRYYWKALPDHVERYVRNCHMCRRCHVPRDKAPGLLHPLHIPSRPWQHLSMDFKSFPKSKAGNDAILVFVDRLGKRPISIPCKKTATARDLARMFIKYIYRYYGAPETIVSDRGPQFVSNFWDQFCQNIGVKIKLSTAEQPQTDGQTEIVNQYIDQRLRPFVNYYQDDWDEMLPIVDFAQASLPHEATGQSAFQTEMAFEPRTSFDWKPITNTVLASEKLNRQEANAWTKRIHDAWKLARANMAKAQERYMKQANKHRREVDFKPKDKVWVTAKTWRTERPSKKLDYQQAGPYEVLERVGHSYRIDLPPGIQVHDVIHASKLRKDPNDPLPGQHAEEGLPIVVDGDKEWEVEEILGVRVSRRQLRYRVKWVGFDHDTDEYLPQDLNHAPILLRDFHQRYPNLPGPPKNLGYWLDCAAKDEFPEKKANDNAV